MEIQKKRKKNFLVSLFPLIAALVIAVVMGKTVLLGAHDETAPDFGTVDIHFVDVGNGDCIIVNSTYGVILVDAGTNESEESVREYIKHLGIEEIDYAVFTHPHDDHIGGADMILREFPVRYVIAPGERGEDAVSESFLAALEESDAEVLEPTSGESFVLGDIEMYVLAPNSEPEGNNGSTVLKMVYGDTSWLLTGDAEAEAEAEMLDKYSEELACDLIKLAHHGSETSTTEEFLRAVSPRLAVVSCGKYNANNHPSPLVLDRLERFGAECFRTDLSGTLVFTSNGREIVLKDQDKS